MPISDPEKLRIAVEHRFNYWICRECGGARNPPGAEKCRRCKSKNLRPKRFKK
ncbi:50S ribosomal protein L40e [Vulcanisaeta distributa]|uniref:50S ribosomal protein L40e n=1 Tax=Vulcanisaeta distributa TaxID=164451 RepID=UPI0006CFCE74|nr:50S ribosomal protein L40e [Vulcanisaeta distributa]